MYPPQVFNYGLLGHSEAIQGPTLSSTHPSVYQSSLRAALTLHYPKTSLSLGKQRILKTILQPLPNLVLDFRLWKHNGREDPRCADPNRAQTLQRAFSHALTATPAWREGGQDFLRICHWKMLF